VLRYVLAVVVATAILAVSLPALDAARIDRSEAAVDAELDSVVDRVERFVAEETAVPPDVAGARTVVTLNLPVRSWSAAGVDHVTLGRSSSGHARFAWSVAGGRRHTRRVPDIRLALAADAQTIVFSSGGRHRLRLRLVRYDGEPVVVASRPDV
jgi:hypothetical protein